MLEINGIQPKLDGHICEDIICQQYCREGKLINEVDVLSIKADGRWHQLYFDSGIVFWRSQQQPPSPYEPQAGDAFSYPLVDFGERYRLKDQLITELEVAPMPEGAKVTLKFERGNALIIYHQDNRSDLRYIPG